MKRNIAEYEAFLDDKAYAEYGIWLMQPEIDRLNKIKTDYMAANINTMLFIIIAKFNEDKVAAKRFIHYLVLNDKKGQHFCLIKHMPV